MEFEGLSASPELVITGCRASNAEEVIRLLSGLALKKGYVNALFIEKILEREQEYPTGLQTAVPIAIPHVHDGCSKSFFAMAAMAEPVDFGAMDGSEEPVKAELVFLFGITDPSRQTAVLRRFSTLFQKEELLRAFTHAADSGELLTKLKEVLGDYILL
ncbi:MAG: PTS sugar transporter subunit IIA [Clostridia bacterium]|nr:PTS sugar transporter subunit IIA [Clostridia bacterium]